MNTRTLESVGPETPPHLATIVASQMASIFAMEPGEKISVSPHRDVVLEITRKFYGEFLVGRRGDTEVTNVGNVHGMAQFYMQVVLTLPNVTVIEDG